MDSLDRRADGVTSISLLGWYGWKADAELMSLAKGSGLCVPELALVPSPPLWGSCSSYTATSWKERQKNIYECFSVCWGMMGDRSHDQGVYWSTSVIQWFKHRLEHTCSTYNWTQNLILLRKTIHFKAPCSRQIENFFTYWHQVRKSWYYSRRLLSQKQHSLTLYVCFSIPQSAAAFKGLCFSQA